MMRKELIEIVKGSVRVLYTKDAYLFTNNLCERCLVHRFAVYLEQNLSSYNVDCEFNKRIEGERTSNKYLSNINGNYVDIIVHKRSNRGGDNLICIEIKKSGNYSGRSKDRRNLEILTSDDGYQYQLGLYVILGKTRKKTKIEIYERGNRIENVYLSD